MGRQFLTYFTLALLCALVFFIFHWGYGYVIAFQSETNDCFYLLGQPFFAKFLDHPAGPIRYAGRYLGQFYHYQWLGALIIMACSACFGLLLYGILRKRNAALPLWSVLLPVGLLLACHTSTLWVLHDTLGLCTICAAFLAYLSMPGTESRRAVALAATVAVYFLAGAYVWILVAWIVVAEWSASGLRPSLAFVAPYIVMCTAMPLVAWRWVYMLPLRSTVICPLMFGPPFRTGWADQSSTSFQVDCWLAAALCIVLLLIPIWGRIFSERRLAAFARASSGLRGRALLIVTVCSLIAFGMFRYDEGLAKLIAYRQLYKARDWDALLAKARQDPYEDYRIQFMTNFALGQRGELLDDMFSYPQPWGTRGLFLNYSGMPVPSQELDDTAEGMYNSDLLLELGHANSSLRHAYNCITINGRTYGNLRRMAECSMVNGNEVSAMKYLNLLEKTLFHREFARAMKETLRDPEEMDRQYGDLRSRLPTIDRFGHPTAYFSTLLESNSENRLALDYLYAWLLLEKESLDFLCADIGHLRDVGRVTLPRHCQEAMLLKQGLTGVPVNPQGFSYNMSIVMRNRELQQFMAGQGARMDKQTVRDTYGDTYAYYWFFVTTSNKTTTETGNSFRAVSREE